MTTPELIEHISHELPPIEGPFTNLADSELSEIFRQMQALNAIRPEQSQLIKDLAEWHDGRSENTAQDDTIIDAICAILTREFRAWLDEQTAAKLSS